MTTDAADPAGTHASWRHIEEFLAEQRATVIRLSPPAEPRVDYVVTDAGSVALHLELGARQRVPHSPLPLVRVDEIHDDGRRLARIRLVRGHLLRDFHDLVNAVADRVLTHDRTPEQAFTETIRAWAALLERPHQLSTEKRAGLFGELLTLGSLAAEYGWSTAVDSWKGPDGEEHDFGLPSFDAEVKTTTSERRVHRVHGLAQFTPTVGRPLWVVSVLITRGGAHGSTLSSLVTELRTKIAEAAPAKTASFDARLAAQGWSSEPQDDERWTLRDVPLVLPADEDLPRLDNSLLDALPNSARPRIGDVTYDTDLTGLEPVPGTPAGLSHFRTPRGSTA